VVQPLGIVHILVPRQATVHRLSPQVREGQAPILRPRVRQALLDEFAEGQAFVLFPDKSQTSVGSDA
jgi:glutaredoxin 2